MTNPARELHEILKRWRDAAADAKSRTSAQSHSHGTPVSKVRGLGAKDGGHAEALNEHMRAMRLVADVEASIDLLSKARPRVDVSPYRRSLKPAIEAVLNYPGAWNAQQDANRLRQDTLDNLMSLSNLLDMTLPDVDEDEREQVLDYLADVEDLLGQDNSLPSDVRQYVAECVRHARRCVEDFELRGQVDLAESLRHLWAALRVAAQDSQTHPSDWRERATKFAFDAGGNVLGGVAGAVLQLTLGGG